MNDKLVQNGKEFMLAVGENTQADMAADITVDGLQKMTQNLSTSTSLPSCEKQSAQELICGVEVSNPGQSGQSIALQDTAIVQTGESLFEKHLSSDISLQQVLSDAISGILMEDAMVMPCGHSFGISGLHRVKETNLCLTCGAPVSLNSMIPNYALRAAVIAYKCEGARRKSELHVQAENDGKRLNRAFADPEVSRSRGVQFPYVANDRVLIKGNKRTPERFVGREAIITTQCLNGWYLVKMLDNGENVRLQYRSLQKLGDKETTTENFHGKLTERICNGDGLKGPLINACRISLSAGCEESLSPNFIDRIEASSFASGIVKAPRLDNLSRANQTSRGRRRGNRLRVADASGASWQTGRTSSNSSEELQGHQVHGKCTHEAATVYDSADEHQRATKRIAALGTTGPAIEGSTLQLNCSVGELKATHFEVWGGDNGGAELKAFREVAAGLAGDSFPVRSSLGPRSQRKHPRARPKHISSQFHKALSSRSDLQEADPYKKVYLSGLRRRGNSGDSHGLMARKQLAVASLNLDSPHCSALPLDEHQNADVKTSYQSAPSFCETLKKRMIDLESEIPWSCMQRKWKTDHTVWHDMLQGSSTLKDVAKRLEEFRRALILEKAGNISDHDWSGKLEAAVEQEDMEAIDYLWRKLHEDISKLMVSKLKRDRKPLNNIKAEFLELKNRFPQLCIGGLSRVGIIAATSMAAAEAYAVGEQDLETLLTIPMKLVQEHNIQDLGAVIDAIEREKRHLSAKVLNLGSGCSNHHKSNVEDADSVLIENLKQGPVSPTFLAIESVEPLMNSEEEPMEENGGEETDLSDSL